MTLSEIGHKWVIILIRRRVMSEDVEMMLSRVKETMDSEDIRKLSILPIYSKFYSCDGRMINECDYSVGGVQLEQLKIIIDDVLHDEYGYDMYEYIDEVLDNLWRII